MIEAKELRIGNKLRSIQTRSIVTVDLFLFCEINDDETYLDHLCPILLTPEILENAYFEKYTVNHTTENWNKGSFVIEVFNAQFKYQGDNRTKGNKYLHQLQNLYYALTGEELNVPNESIK